MCRGVFHSTRSSPSSYKSLFSPTKGKTLSGGQGVQGGPQLEVRRWLPLLPTARRAPVSRPGGVLTADSSPRTGSLRSPQPRPHRTPRDEVCWVSPWKQTRLCFQPKLPHQLHGSPRSLTGKPAFLLPGWEAASGKNMSAGGSVLGPQGARADGSWTLADAASCPRGRAVSRATEGLQCGSSTSGPQAPTGAQRVILEALGRGLCLPLGPRDQPACARATGWPRGLCPLWSLPGSRKSVPSCLPPLLPHLLQLRGVGMWTG